MRVVAVSLDGFGVRSYVQEHDYGFQIVASNFDTDSLSCLMPNDTIPYTLIANPSGAERTWFIGSRMHDQIEDLVATTIGADGGQWSRPGSNR